MGAGKVAVPVWSVVWAATASVPDDTVTPVSDWKGATW